MDFEEHEMLFDEELDFYEWHYEMSDWVDSLLDQSDDV